MGAVIVLITLLVGLLSGLTGGLGQQSISAITGLPTDQIAFQKPVGGQPISYANSTVSEDQWRDWAAVPGVERAEPLGITTTRAVAGDRSTAVSVFGVEPGSTLAPEGDRIADDTVVLSTAAADGLAARTGDDVTVAGQRVRVAGVEGSAYYSHTPVIWSSLNMWQQIAPPSGGNGRTATVIALTTAPGVDLGTADSRIGTTTVAPKQSLSAIGSYTSENGSLQVMRAFLFVISALVVGAFFTVWTIQRSGDVAVLKALGASTAGLLKDALGQAMLLLVAGTATGTVLAAGLGALAGMTSAVPFALTATSILLPAAVMITLGALGAALSIRRITSVDPLTALGSTR
ncbi:ABC transporter permease [Gordonia sp. NPDC003424]